MNLLQVEWFDEAQLDLGDCCWPSYIGVSFRPIRVCRADSAVAPIGVTGLA
jgi:hypothetical protein